MPEKLKRLEEKLISTKEQLKNAKEELEKPFEKADELKSKAVSYTHLDVYKRQVMRLEFLSQSEEQSHFEMLVDLYKEKKLTGHLMDLSLIHI